ncbi:type 3 dihydrofolate reductase [Colwellia sp. MB02u-18]|uniref:type 3 dihydrofolate reductase n=1 Tax=unclassified Colwellia TaxID=196834 RepID=UPI0015F5959C|nr:MULTISPECIES: type 3 dihydrofolate reductase [unclassified Colwellia]MBA6222584.1 type 3 dihydrofolate reductase [Colwellia sp. MB3u-45]MBA6266471.1 type 3 dihydrofolate reductase [Colwellia sp. MB3u-43]MBA6320232.1 type 3 dihydrofolate reductase [Colwellia sp. MB02u-19]MBA6323486.1 type 3 dihydrofolate reductase [Colwellia sp. MB02u-18]MBA6329776.1 type 3 dihydrofolate reductase [Colwellia sp. MB02u-12]
MTILSMIVAHANNRVIGKNNDMPWHLPADLAYFKKTTLGKPIIMGRKTYQSIGRPLPGRKNIVISRDNNFQAEGVEVVNSVDAALALVVDSAEVMVIGGGAIYQHCLAAAQRLYITHINADIDGDTHFPEYDLTVWQKVASDIRPSDEKNLYQLDFSVYEKV